MAIIPASIEAYFLENGFSATELLVLRHLLESDALTLRHLAGKTGKSVGLIGQTVRKLQQKKLVVKEGYNGSARYRLAPLTSITEWMEEDMGRKREELQRKHTNFASFIRSLEIDQGRPDMEFFEGETGIEHAFATLLTRGGEMLQFLPLTCPPEQDPLYQLRIQHFRERRSRRIPARVITHDTPFGRAYRLHDDLSYRQTMLIPESEFPFAYEKIIVGDTIGCFNHAEQRGCLLHWPELAQVERSVFETLWRGRKTHQATPPTNRSNSHHGGLHILSRILTLVRELSSGRRWCCVDQFLPQSFGGKGHGTILQSAQIYSLSVTSPPEPSPPADPP